MDVAGFVDLLTRSGLDVTPLEIAEALWLAGYAAPPARQAPGDRPPPAPPGREPEAEPPDGAGDRESGTPRAPSDRRPVHLPAAPGPGWTSLTGTGIPVPVPASTALPGSLALIRALRPLKLRAPDIRRRTLDEAATIDATARSGALMPVLRAGSERRFSLALVVDTGRRWPSGLSWRRSLSSCCSASRHSATCNGGTCMAIAAGCWGSLARLGPIRCLATLRNCLTRRAGG